MSQRIKILIALIRHEWRVLIRSPIGMVGLVGAVAFMIAESTSAAGWPSMNTALYGFQLAASIVLGVIAFLLAAGSLCRDLEDEALPLLYSRPVSLSLFLLGKYLGTVSFALGLAGVLLLISLGRPLLHGMRAGYGAGPFLLVLALCIVPMLAFTVALAHLLITLTRRVIVALPLYLACFFRVLLPPAQAEEHVALFDFTMRLYPRNLVMEVPIRLADYSFAHLLDPVHPGLLWRCLLHLGLAMLLLAAAAGVLARRRTARSSTAFMKTWMRRTPTASSVGALQ